MRVEPSPVLVAVEPSAVLVDIATTASALTTPLRRFTPSTFALLWALALLGPIDPVVTTSRVLDVATLGTAMRATRSLTIPPSGQSTTWGVGPTVTSAPLTDALAETPNASPLTLFAGAKFHARALSIVTPTSNPIAARLTTYCRIR